MVDRNSELDNITPIMLNFIPPEIVSLILEWRITTPKEYRDILATFGSDVYEHLSAAPIHFHVDITECTHKPQSRSRSLMRFVRDWHCANMFIYQSLEILDVKFSECYPSSTQHLPYLPSLKHININIDEKTYDVPHKPYESDIRNIQLKSMNIKDTGENWEFFIPDTIKELTINSNCTVLIVHSNSTEMTINAGESLLYISLAPLTPFVASGTPQHIKSVKCISTTETNLFLEESMTKTLEDLSLKCSVAKVKKGTSNIMDNLKSLKLEEVSHPMKIKCPNLERLEVDGCQYLGKNECGRHMDGLLSG